MFRLFSFRVIECLTNCILVKRVFKNIIMIVFQSIFLSEMYKNNFFLKKIIYNINTLKQSKNIKKN